MIILIDNYDSFSYNLYSMVGELTDVKIFKNDEITLKEIEDINPSGIIISPGPGRPENAGIIIDLIKNFYKTIPILGVCLGHQAIAKAFGGETIKCSKVYHGKKSTIRLNEKELFKNIKRKIEVMRYHSLVVDENTLPQNIEVIGRNIGDDLIMALKVKGFKTFGVQFHPESIYTDKGKEIIENFIFDICKV